MKGNRVLLLSLLLALVGLMLVWTYLRKQEQALIESATPIKVVVAVRDLPLDTRLDDSLVEVVEVPKRYVQPGAVSEVSLLYDRVLNVPVLMGTQILESMFKPTGAESLAQKVPAGLRAVSIAANPVTAVSGLIKPGDTVDVFVTVETGSYDLEGRVMPQDTMTRRILQNVLVLANNRMSSKSSYEREAFRDGQHAPGSVFSQTQVQEEDRSSVIRTLTLALSPEDTQKVTLAQEIGSVVVALCSAWDQADGAAVSPLTSRDLLGIQNNVIRKSMPAWVEIRGAERINPISE